MFSFFVNIIMIHTKKHNFSCFTFCNYVEHKNMIFASQRVGLTLRDGEEESLHKLLYGDKFYWRKWLEFVYIRHHRRFYCCSNMLCCMVLWNIRVKLLFTLVISYGISRIAIMTLKIFGNYFLHHSPRVATSLLPKNKKRHSYGYLPVFFCCFYSYFFYFNEVAAFILYLPILIVYLSICVGRFLFSYRLDNLKVFRIHELLMLILIFRQNFQLCRFEIQAYWYQNELLRRFVL